MIWAGSIVGAVLGLIHAVYVYRVVSVRAPDNTSPNHMPAVYFALWTFVLWVLMGTYVLVLWLAGAVLYVIFKMLR